MSQLREHKAVELGLHQEEENLVGGHPAITPGLTKIILLIKAYKSRYFYISFLFFPIPPFHLNQTVLCSLNHC